MKDGKELQHLLNIFEHIPLSYQACLLNVGNVFVGTKLQVRRRLPRLYIPDLGVVKKTTTNKQTKKQTNKQRNKQTNKQKNTTFSSGVKILYSEF